MKVRFQVMLQSGKREKHLQSVTGELPFVEMLSGGGKKVNATRKRFKKRGGNQLMAAQWSDIY